MADSSLGELLTPKHEKVKVDINNVQIPLTYQSSLEILERIDMSELTNYADKIKTSRSDSEYIMEEPFEITNDNEFNNVVYKTENCTIYYLIKHNDEVIIKEMKVGTNDIVIYFLQFLGFIICFRFTKKKRDRSQYENIEIKNIENDENIKKNKLSNMENENTESNAVLISNNLINLLTTHFTTFHYSFDEKKEIYGSFTQTDKLIMLYLYGNYIDNPESCFNYISFIKIGIYLDERKENEKIMKILYNYTKENFYNFYSNLCYIYEYDVLKLKLENLKELIPNIETDLINKNLLNVYITISEELFTIDNYLTTHFKQIFMYNNEIFKITILLKLLINFLNGAKQLNELSIIHCDISFSNVAFRIGNSSDLNERIYARTYNYSENDSDDLLFSKILFRNNFAMFSGVLFDFNSSKMENDKIKLLNSSNDTNKKVNKEVNDINKGINDCCNNENSGKNNEEEEYNYFPAVKYGYFPNDYIDLTENNLPTIAFTKYHDIYSIAIVCGQLVDLLFTTYLTLEDFERKCKEMKKEGCFYLKDIVTQRLNKFIKNGTDQLLCNVELSEVLKETILIILHLIEKPNTEQNYFESLHKLTLRLIGIVFSKRTTPPQL
ncbi:hypothetical protein ABK040_014119 [Willaertia magna]